MLTFVFSKITVYWDVTSSSLMDGRQQFGKMSCAHLQFCLNSECGGSNFLQNVDTFLTKLHSAASYNTRHIHHCENLECLLVQF